MSEQTMTGPARLRQIAEFTILSAAELRQLAALWEADLSYAAGLIADEILRAERAEAALDRATNDLMLSEESFVKMRDKRDDVLRELHAKSAALEHANRFLEQETFTRQKYGDQLHATEAALEQAQTQVALYEGRHPAQLGPDGQEVAPRHRYTDEGVCIRCGEDAEEWDAGCVEELAAELEKKAAALERALALAEKWRNYENDPIPLVHRRMADELAAALLAAAPGGAA